MLTQGVQPLPDFVTAKRKFDDDNGPGENRSREQKKKKKKHTKRVVPPDGAAVIDLVDDEHADASSTQLQATMTVGPAGISATQQNATAVSAPGLEATSLDMASTSTSSTPHVVQSIEQGVQEPASNGSQVCYVAVFTQSC